MVHVFGAKQQLIMTLKQFNSGETLKRKYHDIECSGGGDDDSTDDRLLSYSNNEQIAKFNMIFNGVRSQLHSSIYSKSESIPWSNVFVTDELLQLVGIFKNFDPINNTTQFTKKYESCIEFTSMDNENYAVYEDERGRIIASYLVHPNFNESVLKNTKWDYMINAILTYLLASPIDTLLYIKFKYPKFKDLCAMIFEEKFNNHQVYTLTSTDYTWPYTRMPFKILSKVFIHDATATVNNTLVKNVFSLLDYLDLSFIAELNEFNDKLHIINGIDGDYTRRVLERVRAIPYDIQHIVGKYDTIIRQSNIRYFTGVACCGKTTLVSKLNYYAKSRGDLGGFSGKADNLASVSCLHFSIDFALRQYSNTIGDRGNIDNTLWLWIMNHCGEEHQATLIKDVLTFVDSNFNAATLAYFMSQNVVIFIDPHPHLNSARMLNRGTGADSTRGRIKYYAHTQAAAYYTVARLFGWRVFCVPYSYDPITNIPTFDPKKYDEIAREINLQFNTGRKYNAVQMETDRFDKPSNVYKLDNNYSKSVGIHK